MPLVTEILQTKKEICGLQQYQCKLSYASLSHGDLVLQSGLRISQQPWEVASFMEEFAKWRSSGLSGWPKVVQQGAKLTSPV